MLLGQKLFVIILFLFSMEVPEKTFMNNLFRVLLVALFQYFLYTYVLQQYTKKITNVASFNLHMYAIIHENDKEEDAVAYIDGSTHRGDRSVWGFSATIRSKVVAKRSGAYRSIRLQV